MSSSPRIVVFKKREILYTLLLLFLVILLVVCLVLMFTKKTEGQSSPAKNTRSTDDSSQNRTSLSIASDTETAAYVPGVYTTPITLGDSAVDVEVTVDDNRINSIRLVNLSEATAASFPLVSPSLDHIASQILAAQSLDGITCPQENQYTSQMLLSAVADALSQARK